MKPDQIYFLQFLLYKSELIKLEKKLINKVYYLNFTRNLYKSTIANQNYIQTFNDESSIMQLQTNY
ncbi:hypothetical protein BpHYR1_000579 [Brachionus plicatilis]|uniref:Uncharacterized protein n=1 Tax=Brachionus plicatilis TaxID=10195 RepID=A0A3M7T4C9_BRAPC|nr:hypothetical protein BpHYR1_000579 [Brachionus plicatilis]